MMVIHFETLAIFPYSYSQKELSFRNFNQNRSEASQQLLEEGKRQSNKLMRGGDVA